jgi:precorrin-2 dehydrogenase/sirohydrochlorin ferrochelatase
VVVGGGSAAAREVASLLDCGASVRVIAPTAAERLTMLAQAQRIELNVRAYIAEDLAGATLAFACADQPTVNAAVAADARATGILCAVADDPDISDFSEPAGLRRGDLTIAVAQDDNVPGYAQRVRDVIAVRVGPEYGEAMSLYASVRAKIAAAPAERHASLWDALFALDLPRVVHDRGLAAAQTALDGWIKRQRLA